MAQFDAEEGRQRSGSGLPPGGEPAIEPDGGAGVSDRNVGVGGTTGGGGHSEDGGVGGSDPTTGTTPGAGGATSGGSAGNRG